MIKIVAMNTLLKNEQTAQRFEEPDFQIPLFIDEDNIEELFDESLDDL